MNIQEAISERYSVIQKPAVLPRKRVIGHKWIKRMALCVLISAGIVGIAAWYSQSTSSSPVIYSTVTLTRGDAVVTISATGTLEPEEVVDVGAQVAGRVLAFGKDKGGRAIDYGAAVEEGTVLAQIDESLYAADLAQAEAQMKMDRASVSSAQANLQLSKAKLDQSRLDVQQDVARQEQSEASLLQAKVKLEQARRNWERAQTIGVESGAISKESYETYNTAHEDAQANRAFAQAALRQAKIAIESGKTAVAQAEANVAAMQASVAQSEANVARSCAAMDRARQNVGYCTIHCPVKGVIIDRRVNIGQTVVASLNTPSLFLIAKDLKRMQIWVSVNEADVGKIKSGQPVTFTVDAFPGETFRGEVSKLRLNASMTQNVVNYVVEITTDNSSSRLLPYLTANVRIEVARSDNVYLVPNAALLWTPSKEQIAPGASEQQASSGGTLWIRDGQQVRSLAVRAGLSDGALTEVQGEGLAVGIEIVTGLETVNSSQTGSANPFTPKMPALPKGARGGPPM